MDTSKNLALAAVAAMSALLAASAAVAACPAMPATPTHVSDALMVLKDCVWTVTPLTEPIPGLPETPYNTGIRTHQSDGSGVKLQEFSSTLNRMINSDFIYAWHGFIYVDSPEQLNPQPFFPISVAALTPYTENGTWQYMGASFINLPSPDGSGFFPIDDFENPPPFWVYSAIPEPAAWGLMTVGGGLLGAVLRRRRETGALSGA